MSDWLVAFQVSVLPSRTLKACLLLAAISVDRRLPSAEFDRDFGFTEGFLVEWSSIHSFGWATSNLET